MRAPALLILSLCALLHCQSWRKFWATSAPQNISFGNQRLDKLIPGLAFSYVPNVAGVVETWALSPALPAGLNFNAENGSISGTPGGTFALTYYTLTASNFLGSASYVFPLAILASGDTVWTVISGGVGNFTRGTEGSLIFDSATNRLIVGGATRVNLEGEINPTGGTNTAAFFSAYTTDGKRIITRILGGATFDTHGIGARIDGSGNVYLGGTTNGSLDGQLIGGSTDQMFVTKFDSGGSWLWTRARRSGTNYTRGSGLAVDNAGTTYTCGYMNGGNFDGITNTAGTDNGAFLVRHDTAGGWTAGTRAWFHNGPAGSRNVEGYGVTLDSTGNIWVVGTSQSTDYCANPLGTLTPTIFRFDSSMTYQNCGSVSAAGTGNFLFSAVGDTLGNVYVSGYAGGTIDGVAPIGATDAIFIKFNNAGTRVFTRRLGIAGGTTQAFGITRSVDDYYYLTGETNGNLNGQTLNGSIDMFVAKYDNTGTLQWVKLMGAAGTAVRGRALAFDNNNTIYVSGYSNGNYDGVTNPAAPNDALLVTRFVR